ncbi:MAG: Gfo/Idh/MocA family oxidoreductase [Burkholderiales bacterium]|nr:Gfo/Idh/MocA family oxidoreductase [Burkholderiales bacterium]
MSTSRLRWGIIGLGWVSTDLVCPGMKKSPGSEIAACLGSSAEKGQAFAQRFGVPRVHATLSDMMQDADVDAVYVATPNALHKDAVLAAARAGKHVLCEKPFAMSVADARAMVQACRGAGIVLRIAHQLRMEQAVNRARDIVRSGALGRVAAISIERSSAMPPRTTWRKDVRQSGVVFDVGVHLIDQIHWITGQRFAEVSAFTHPDRTLGSPDDQITILGRLADDGHALIRATREIASPENNLVIEGTQATLVTSALRFADEHVLRIRDAKGTREERFAASPNYDLEIPAFESDVKGKPSGLPTGEESVHVVATTRAVLASVEERRIITVDE